MASNNKTAALGLNQWALTDPFLMEDFNEDNRKIDAAVARKSEFVKLKEVTTTVGGVSQIDVDVSDIDFGAWQYVLMDVVSDKYGFVRVNNNTSGGFNQIGGSSGWSGGVARCQGYSRLLFLTNLRSSEKVYAVSYNASTLYAGGNGYVAYGDVRSLNLVCQETNGYFGAGNKIVLWGVR